MIPQRDNGSTCDSLDTAVGRFVQVVLQLEAAPSMTELPRMVQVRWVTAGEEEGKTFIINAWLKIQQDLAQYIGDHVVQMYVGGCGLSEGTWVGAAQEPTAAPETVCGGPG